MPWISIIMALVAFLMSKKNGANTTKAALVGAAAGVGTYYLADPANPDNLLGVSFGGGAKVTPGSTAESTGGQALVTPIGVNSGVPVSSILAPLAAGAAVGAGLGSGNWLWLLIGGVGLFLITR